jgi:uncharacterized protein involved in response to NO
MAVINIEEPNKPGLAWLRGALGFRPFFLLAGVVVVLFVPLWLWLLPTAGNPSLYYPDGLNWHRHEMLFGFAAAVIAGFLLTAVHNWTNLPTPTGWPLLGLVILWLAGRWLPFTPLPGLVIAVVDLLFTLILALLLAWPIVRAKQLNNQIFPLILLLLTGANAMVHLEILGVTRNTATTGIMAALLLSTWVVVVMGGRVIPFFIERATQGFERKSWKSIEWLSLATMVLLLVAVFLDLPGGFQAICAFAAALVHLIRLAGWYTHQLWKTPLIWVLWLGYLWMVIGFALHGLALFQQLPMTLAIHAYTVGGLGVLTLGMMARVAIGHTGRMMQLTSVSMVWAFVLVNLAALVRVFLPLVMMKSYIITVMIAGTLWVAGFLIFVIIYWPILTQPRIDNRPG